MSQPVYRHTFAAMGSTVEIVLVGGSAAEAGEAFALGEWLAAEWERTFSRFRPDSELSHLNRRSGEAVTVSDLLYSAIEMAIRAAAHTGGLFDPTVLPSLTALGYDRTFGEISERGDLPGGLSAAPGVSGIALDPKQRTVRLPAGVQLDLGGLAKGLYADVLAGTLAGWDGGVVSAGGDLRVWGTSPDRDRWSVGIEDPDDPMRDVATVLVTDCGVATSGANRRTWLRGGRPLHHLIDPRTGWPVESRFRSVTSIAPTAVRAEIASLALFVGGPTAAENEAVRSLFALALAVGRDGEIVGYRGAATVGENGYRQPAT